MTIIVRHSPEQSRYEIHGGETPVGFPGCGITDRKTAFAPAQVLTLAQGSW